MWLKTAAAGDTACMSGKEISRCLGVTRPIAAAAALRRPAILRILPRIPPIPAIPAAITIPDPYEYGYYDENGVWHNVTKEFYEKWSGNAATGEAGVVGVVLLTAAAAGAMVVLRKKK